jgi:hypothetical protein
MVLIFDTYIPNGMKESAMSAVAFDALKLATKLEKAGFSPEQAKGASVTLAESLDGSSLATKSDIKESVAELKVDIVRWLIITQLALGGFIFAALRLVK